MFHLDIISVNQRNIISNPYISLVCNFGERTSLRKVTMMTLKEMKMAEHTIQAKEYAENGLVGVRHSGDFCDGCACDDKVCETCPWAQYVPDNRK